MKIKEIAVSERPRERLVCSSVNSLSDAELFGKGTFLNPTLNILS